MSPDLFHACDVKGSPESRKGRGGGGVWGVGPDVRTEGGATSKTSNVQNTEVDSDSEKECRKKVPDAKAAATSKQRLGGESQTHTVEQISSMLQRREQDPPATRAHVPPHLEVVPAEVVLVAAAAAKAEDPPATRAHVPPHLEVVPVEVVLVAAAAAKVEDHASALAATASSTQLALLDERAERREARARADHDDGCGVRGRQPEVGVLVDVDVRDVADGQALAHKSGADADAVDTVCRVLDLQGGRVGCGEVWARS
eukprot:182342-Chlamydomonas_euryale.AAC.1